MVYLWSTGIIFEVYPFQYFSKEYLRSRACLDLNKNTTNYTLIVKNCGLVSLSKFQLYMDYIPVDANFPNKMEPKEQTSIYLGFITGKHVFLVTSDLAESPPLTIQFPLVFTGGPIEPIMSEEGCVNPVFCNIDEDCCPGYYCTYDLGITDFGRCAKL
ncbi:MAG: hypothetical protein ACE5J3_10995 [Methanosarcinales archaeon]